LFRAENFADIVEFRALATVMGPYGFKLIEREILKLILLNVNSLKDFLAANKDILEEFARTYPNEAHLPETLKKIKGNQKTEQFYSLLMPAALSMSLLDLDNFVLRSIAIGNALHFRDLMHDAIRQISEERIPLIFNTISTAYSQYKRNTFMTPSLLVSVCVGVSVSSFHINSFPLTC
jgi:hypothetical protein